MNNEKDNIKLDKSDVIKVWGLSRFIIISIDKMGWKCGRIILQNKSVLLFVICRS